MTRIKAQDMTINRKSPMSLKNQYLRQNSLRPTALLVPSPLWAPQIIKNKSRNNKQQLEIELKSHLLGLNLVLKM
jgi:hypothetical protein